MPSVVEQIEEVIAREGRAWRDGDVDLLLSIFHPDLVWVWPQTGGSCDPLEWISEVGRFDAARWRQGWAEIFSFELLRNQREIRKIVVSPENDGAFAVVDCDIEWRPPNGDAARWQGRAMKTYALREGRWLMMTHIGL